MNSIVNLAGYAQAAIRTAWRPRVKGFTDSYPLDCDGSLRYTRFKTGIDKWPHVPQIGAVTGLMRQMDALILGNHIGKTPSGPGVTSYPVNLQMQVIVPGLYKTS